MDFSTRALNAAFVPFAVQVARLPWAARDNTAAWMPHTLAATLTGAMTETGMLLTLTCRPLAMLLRTLLLIICTLTSGPTSNAAWAGVDVPAPKLRTAAANGSAIQDLNEACIVFLRMIVSLGPSLHFSTRASVDPCPIGAAGSQARGQQQAVAPNAFASYLFQRRANMAEVMLALDNNNCIRWDGIQRSIEVQLCDY